MIKFLNRKNHLAIFQYIEYQRLKAKDETIHIREMCIVTDAKKTIGDDCNNKEEFLEFKWFGEQFNAKGESTGYFNLNLDRLPLSVLFDMVALDLGVVQDSLAILNSCLKDLKIKSVNDLTKWGMTEDEIYREKKLQTIYKTSGTIWKPIP